MKWFCRYNVIFRVDGHHDKKKWINLNISVPKLASVSAQTDETNVSWG